MQKAVHDSKKAVNDSKKAAIDIFTGEDIIWKIHRRLVSSKTLASI